MDPQERERNERVLENLLRSKPIPMPYRLYIIPKGAELLRSGLWEFEASFSNLKLAAVTAIERAQFGMVKVMHEWSGEEWNYIELCRAARG